MNERDKLIEKLIKEKGGSREDYLNLLDSIGYHESRLDPTIKQLGGGPGRGKYQFETGKNAGGITAARRTKQYYQNNNIPVPEWLQNATSTNDLDVSNLSSEQQDILFLGNMRQHPKADFSKVWKGEKSIKDFWLDHHWAGKTKDRNERAKSFDSSITEFKKNKLQKDNLSFTQKENKENINSYKNTTNQKKEPTFWEGVKDGAVHTLKRMTGLPSSFIDNTPKPVENNTTYTPSIFLQNKKAMGGKLPPSVYLNNSNIFGTGGTHEQNPNGGIQQGMGSNGKMNTVEEGEFSYNFEDGKYIFSNRF